MEDKNIRQLHRQLVIAEEAEAADAVELADPQQDARIVVAVTKHLEEKGELSSAQPPPPRSAAPSPSGSTALFSRPRSRAALIAGLSLAAVLSITVLLRGPGGPEKREAVASYEITIPSDDRVAGSAPEEPPPSPIAGPSRLSLDSVLQVNLRPQRQVSKDVQAVAFLKSGESIKPWPVTFVRSEQGTFLLRGKIANLPGLGLGRWELVFIIGYPDRVPSPTELAQLLRSGAATGDGWQILRGSIEIVPPNQVR